jgi:superfamily II RNA helicase
MEIKHEFKLDKFQEEAISYINNGYNVLVSAPTGCGKTIIAEHGIQYVSKKYPDCQIYYTCPIKSLCNEKYYDFSTKYKKNGSNLTFGLATGDFIINKNANVIIATTEILCNMLINKNKKEINQEIKDYFKTDEEKNKKNEKIEQNRDAIDNIKCVIFDEAHYINCDSRGHIWEKSIIMSGQYDNCLLILLSATIGNIDVVIEWLNNINSKKQFKKVVKLERPVPLREYFIDNSKCKNFKKKDKKSIEDIKEQKKLNSETCDFNIKQSNATNDPSTEEYEILSINDNNYSKIKKYWEKLNESEYSVKFEIQTICNQVASNEGLGIPAIIFVFSKAKCIEFGEMIEASYTTFEESTEILRFYDESLKEFFANTQYINLRKIIGKGIAYHHSGLIPKIREVVEFLIKRKLVKFVFCTETFALGLNFPVKTVVLLALNKPTEDGFRNLTVSEYKQMAGRAGRRFIDSYGNVIIWLMGYKNKKIMSWGEINNIINGPIDKITSKYVIEPIFILKNINDEIDKQISMKSFSYYKSKKNQLVKIIIPDKLKIIYNIKVQAEEIEKSGMRYNMKKYDKLFKGLSIENKKEYEDILIQRENNKKKTDLDYYDDFKDYIYNFLEKINFIKNEDNKYNLTINGEMAQLFYEINPIIFINDLDFILKDDVLETLSMFIDDGLRDNEDSISHYIDESILYFENRTKELYLPFIKKYPKWNFYPMNYVFLKYWLSDETITLDNASKKFGYDQGVIIKVLVKMYQISDELIDNLTTINRTNMIEHVNIKRQLLIRLPLRLESLYINY